MNDCHFSGRVGRVNFSQAQNGNPYVGFCVEEKKVEDETGRKNLLWVNCFQHNVIKYLKALNFKIGDYVAVEASAESFTEEIKGTTYSRQGFNAKKVWIVKTMKDAEQQNNKQQ